MMRTEEPRPVRLAEYRPPDWLVETVDLDVTLHPTRTPVRATLKLKPNPAAGAPAPLVLDGDGLDAGLAQARRRAARRPSAMSRRPTASPSRSRRTGRSRSRSRPLVDPTGQHPALRALPVERHLLHAVRGRGLPPHHLFPRPAGRDGGLHHAHRGGQSRSAGAALQRQSASTAASCRAAGISRSGTTRSRSPPICSRWSAASSACVEDRFVTMSGRKVALRIYVEPGKEDRCGYAMDSLKRAMRWDEQAFGREYDLDVFMIVAVSDFNMGAMENKGLNVFNDKYVLASPDDRDRQRLRRDRGHHRARVFPQLDRQPHHLPRLVPALPQGRPDRLPRPGVHLRPALARRSTRIGDVRGLRAHQFVEDAGPLAHPVRPERLSRDQQFLHHDRLREGRRGGAHAARRCSARSVPQRHGPLLRAPRRPGGDGRAVRAMLRRRQRPRSRRSSCAGIRRPARRRSSVTGRYDAGAKTYRLDLAQVVPPTPGQPSKEPMVIPLVIGLVGRDGRDLPLKLADGRTIERGVLVLDKPAESFRVHRNRRNARCSRSIAASRRRSSSSPISTRTICAFSRRTTAIRSTAGRRCRRWRARCLVGNVARLRAGRSRSWTKACSMRSPPSSPTATLEPAFVAAGADPAEREPTSPARSAAMSIRTRSFARARRLRALIGLHLNAALTATYRSLADSGPYSPDAASAGRRTLKNVCLDLLAATGESHAIAARRRSSIEAADNMTDRMAALSTLSLHDVPERDRGVRRFLPALSRRPADRRQVVRAAGDDAGCRDARSRARAHRASGFLACPIPIACAR